MLEEEVELFLEHHKLKIDTDAIFLLAKLPVIFLPSQHLAIHCISLENLLLENLSAAYFVQLTDQAIRKKIKLIHLWEDYWINKNEVVKSRLLSLCGRSERIHARDAKVIRMHKKETDAFLLENHLQGTTSAYYKYGLTYKDKLVAVATFGKSRVMHDGPVYYRSYELERYTSKLHTTVVGGLGKLLSHFIRESDPAHMMTYADRDWSEGNSYEKLGFVRSGYTEPQEFYIHPAEMKRYYPQRLPQKYSSVSELQEAGYVKIYNAGNAKWILDRRDQTS